MPSADDYANLTGLPAVGTGLLVPPDPPVVAQGYAIGDVRPWFTATIPTGWVAMAGQSTAGMGSVIVAMYGAVLPDMRDRLPMGASAAKPITTTGGSETVALTTANLPAHTHTGPSHSHTSASHTHTGPSHTHTGPSHTHAQNVAAAVGGVLGRADYDADANVSPFSQEINTEAAGTGPTGAAGTGATGATAPPDTGASGTGATGSTGSGTAATIVPRYVAVHWIVRIA